MKAESAIVTAAVIGTFLSFYFSLLSFMTIDDSLKKQFVLLAVYSLLSSIIVFCCLLIYLVMKKVFERQFLFKLHHSDEQTREDSSSS